MGFFFFFFNSSTQRNLAECVDQVSGARFDWKQLRSPSHLVSALTKEAVPCGCLTKTFVSGHHSFLFVLLNAQLKLAFSPSAWDEASEERDPRSEYHTTPQGNTVLPDPSPWSLWGFLFPSCPSVLSLLAPLVDQDVAVTSQWGSLPVLSRRLEASRGRHSKHRFVAHSNYLLTIVIILPK